MIQEVIKLIKFNTLFFIGFIAFISFFLLGIKVW